MLDRAVRRWSGWAITVPAYGCSRSAGAIMIRCVVVIVVVLALLLTAVWLALGDIASRASSVPTRQQRTLCALPRVQSHVVCREAGRKTGACTAEGHHARNGTELHPAIDHSALSQTGGVSDVHPVLCLHDSPLTTSHNHYRHTGIRTRSVKCTKANCKCAC